MAGAGRKTAYLTFDDGPSPNTSKVLDVLKNEQVKATFFVIGDSSAAGVPLYKRICQEGHAIGNHSFTHNYSKLYRSVSEFKRDFYQLEKLLQVTINKKPAIMRFPGGSNNTVSHKYSWPGIMQVLVSEMAGLGYTHFDWNVDAQDATTALKNSWAITNNVLKGTAGKDNAIILLHDGWGNQATPQALPGIINGLRQQGFTFKTLTPTSYRVQFIKP